jgi:hypothetical protein
MNHGAFDLCIDAGHLGVKTLGQEQSWSSVQAGGTVVMRARILRVVQRYEFGDYTCPGCLKSGRTGSITVDWFA